MSANVETMFYVREKPWHGLGTMVQEAPTSADALRLAGLDWTVEARDMWLNGGYEPIPGYKANVRSSDNKVLGVVSDKYRIVQNADAFAFTDALIGGDVHYETAGSLLDGKKIWLLAKLPDSEICGDKTEPYVCFSNTHDGSGAVRVCMTPVRVVCNNTLNLALNTAQRAWSVRHVGDISTKLVEAQQCLEMAGKYMDALAERADQMANTTVSDERLRKILDELFPEADDMSNIQKRHVQEMKDGYMVCVMAPRPCKVPQYRMGRGERHERFCYPQRPSPQHEELSGQQLEQRHGRSLADRCHDQGRFPVNQKAVLSGLTGAFMNTQKYYAWYTVWDRKTGRLLCSGRPADCAKALGFASKKSFWASIRHSQKRGHQRKYEVLREEIRKSEVD